MEIKERALNTLYIKLKTGMLRAGELGERHPRTIGLIMHYINEFQGKSDIQPIIEAINILIYLCETPMGNQSLSKFGAIEFFTGFRNFANEQISGVIDVLLGRLISGTGRVNLKYNNQEILTQEEVGRVTNKINSMNNVNIETEQTIKPTQDIKVKSVRENIPNKTSTINYRGKSSINTLKRDDLEREEGNLSQFAFETKAIHMPLNLETDQPIETDPNHEILVQGQVEIEGIYIYIYINIYIYM